MQADVVAAADLASAVASFVADGGRLLGLAGPPGAGKSTLAAQIVSGWPGVSEKAVAVGLDGFHIGQAELERQRIADRKGAPHTFDVDGYRVALERIARRDGTIYLPRFDRTIEDSIAAAVAVEPDHELVVTEGNYLLVDDPAWEAVHAALDQCWYLDLDDAVRRGRLVDRHIAHGRSPADAETWVAHNDDPNAVLVAGSRDRADRVVLMNSVRP